MPPVGDPYRRPPRPPSLADLILRKQHLFAQWQAQHDIGMPTLRRGPDPPLKHPVMKVRPRRNTYS